MDLPSTPPPPPPPQQQQQQCFKRSDLSRDKRLRIQLLKELYWKHTAIAEHEDVLLR